MRNCSYIFLCFQFLVLGAVLAVASAGVIAPVAYNAAPTYNAAPVYSAAPVYAAAPAYVAPKAVYKEPEVPKNYDFGYVVNDPKKHDFHSRHESRHNGVVQGKILLVSKNIYLLNFL